MEIDLLYPRPGWTMSVSFVQGVGTVRITAKSPAKILTWDYDMMASEALVLAQMIEEIALSARQG